MYDVLVIGGGPCGVSASIYLKRAGYNVAIIEKSFIGGQIGLSSELVNYAGFVDKDAFVFCQNLSKQLQSFNIPVITAEVLHIEKNSDKMFKVQTANDVLICKACILSIGAENRKLGFANEEKFIGRGISYCAICDGNRYRGKDVLVVGGGNSAFEDAIYLSKICNKVYLVNRTDKFRAEKHLQDELDSLKVENGGNVQVSTFTELKDVVGDDVVSGAVIQTKDERKTLNVQGVFIAIGRVPSSSFLQGFVELDKNYIIVDSNYQTSIQGVYAGGDCIPKLVRQVVTAVSDGAIIAKNITNYLQSRG